MDLDALINAVNSGVSQDSLALQTFVNEVADGQRSTEEARGGSRPSMNMDVRLKTRSCLPER